MLFDANLILSGAFPASGAISGQAVLGSGNVLSTNTIDAGPLALGGNQVGDIGAGEPLHVVFHVLTAPTFGTTVRFQLIQADDAALTSNVQVINQTDDIPIASLPAGTLVPLRWNSMAAPKRYIGARYVNVGTIATFSVFAAIVKDAPVGKNVYFKSGFTVA